MLNLCHLPRMIFLPQASFSVCWQSLVRWLQIWSWVLCSPSALTASTAVPKTYVVALLLTPNVVSEYSTDYSYADVTGRGALAVRKKASLYLWEEEVAYWLWRGGKSRTQILHANFLFLITQPCEYDSWGFLKTVYYRNFLIGTEVEYYNHILSKTINFVPFLSSTIHTHFFLKHFFKNPRHHIISLISSSLYVSNT